MSRATFDQLSPAIDRWLHNEMVRYEFGTDAAFRVEMRTRHHVPDCPRSRDSRSRCPGARVASAKGVGPAGRGERPSADRSEDRARNADRSSSWAQVAPGEGWRVRSTRRGVGLVGVAWPRVNRRMIHSPCRPGQFRRRFRRRRSSSSRCRTANSRRRWRSSRRLVWRPGQWCSTPAGARIPVQAIAAPARAGHPVGTFHPLVPISRPERAPALMRGALGRRGRRSGGRSRRHSTRGRRGRTVLAIPSHGRAAYHAAAGDGIELPDRAGGTRRGLMHSVGVDEASARARCGISCALR